MSRVVSFRDPGGSVSVIQDRVIRTVFPEGVANLRACLNSSVARRFVEAGSLVATHTLEGDASVPDRRMVVEHPRIPFISYPHEWPSAMLHAAARLTLELCSSLLDEGLGLKDATPSNILFRGPCPVFIDVLSMEERDPLDPIWLADAQFARTFLIPLLLNRRTGYPIHELFMFHRDGIAPEEAVRRLPVFRRWFSPDLGLVTLPARAARFESDRLYSPRQARDAGEARFILAHRFRALRKKLDVLEPGAVASPWSNYEAACPSYSNEQHSAKRQWLENVLREIKPAHVLDVGSNTGEFSFMAAATGASVVSIDRDPETVAALWRSAAAAGADILPLVMDFARPSPPAGWRCQEHSSFLERGGGFFDCALFLAVTHHLMVSDQIPLDQIFDSAASLTTRWLVIEYIGPQYPMFHRLARGRDALYRWYSRSVFDDCARRSFDIVRSLDLPSSDRAIYLLRRKS
ncbi:MAG: class I SAM-dependent methyltransferase [Bryobacteraceae bacterium]|jgi:SAM-dependent methyltransferase